MSVARPTGKTSLSYDGSLSSLPPTHIRFELHAEDEIVRVVVVDDCHTELLDLSQEDLNMETMAVNTAIVY